MVIIKEEGLTYDDVLLIPKRSPVKSRKDITLKTKLTKTIELNTPIVSANMDTVTEAEMAVAMARMGAIGIIHRFLTIEEQVKEVLKVKRKESFIIDKPLTLHRENTIEDAKKIIKEFDISSILITDKKGKLDGIVTRRDLMFIDKEEGLEQIMTPKEKIIAGNISIGKEEAKDILKKNRIEKLPLIDDEGYLKGLITSKDIAQREKFRFACKDEKGRLRVAAAVGIKNEDYERARKLLGAGADAINVDIAHRHSDIEISFIKDLKKEFPNCQIIGGTVATPEGVEDLIKTGADCIKVGIGAGAMCTTRIVAGAGYPQLSAVIACAKMAKKYGIPISADAGIRASGDIVKALAAGADTVMFGSMFAGTDESPGDFVKKDGIRYKIHRGMASLKAAETRLRLDGKDDINLREIVPEGAETLIPYKGSVYDILKQLIGGIQSGFSYGGARNLEELQLKAEFVKITNAAFKESGPHGKMD